MLAYNIVTAICFALLTGFGVYFAVACLCKKHRARVEFVRSFKKGKIAIIYVISIPLYFIGHLYAGKTWLESLFQAINKVINTVVLKYDTGSIYSLMEQNGFYMFTVYYCFAMIAFNALLLTFSLVGQRLWLFYKGVCFRLLPGKKLIVVGNNEGSCLLYRSAHKKYSRVIFDEISGESGAKLYASAINYRNFSGAGRIAKKILACAARRKKEFSVVINTGNEDKNLSICYALVSRLNEIEEKYLQKYYSHLRIYVYGDPRYAAIYEDVVSSAFGLMHYVNKYQQMAMDFVEKYPLTQFMDERQIDYSTSLISSDVEINVFLIGFGKTNQQIFLTSVANNQFLTASESGGDPVLKQVNYLIFDKQRSENNKNMNHSYYRFRNEMMAVDHADYLEFPEIPAQEIYYKLDVNDVHFYARIREKAMRNPKDVNYVIIAFGTDLENMDMAQKLVEKRREWGIDNLVIFVKVRKWTQRQTLLEDEGCYFIANEKEVVYNIEEVTGDRIYRMAHMRNEIYDIEYDVTHSHVKELTEEEIAQKKAQSDKRWYTAKSQLERESNVYASLSLRSKLHLMGLDYCPIDSEDKREALTEEEYLTRYAGDDQPDFDHYKCTADGKRIVYYTLDFKDSRRKNMAIHEHQRWNSFMISKGIVPASKSQILREMVEKDGALVHSNGRNYRLRRHGNLTTFNGLVDFRRMIAQRDGVDELEADVIKYDYQLLDDAYWILTKSGQKIVKKQ